MVCLGNICRSPMAEGIMRHKLKELGNNSQVDSAGTGGWHAGQNPDERAVKTMNQHGLDISNLVARQFKKSDFDRFDLILAMDESNYDDILRLSSHDHHRKKVQLILSYSATTDKNSVPDPWFGGMNGFEHVFQLLDEACEQVIKSHFK